MIVQTYSPKSNLRHFVSHFVFYEGFEMHHAVDRFLPDGNVEIIIDLLDRPQYIYDNESLKEIQTCHNVWASGVRTEPITIPSGTDSVMFIIAFKRGMAYPFFPLPMDEIVDHVVDADLLWGDEFALLREHILENKDSIKKFGIAEQFLNRKLHKQFVKNPSVEFALSEIIKKPDQTSMKRLSEKVGYSQKHFISMFKKQVGLSPKNYLKIMRFQKAISEIEILNDVDWSLIAYDCGFYDQAHFINDFKTYSGFTPENYLKRKNGVLNYVPIG